MRTATARTFDDGNGEVLLIPDELGFGVDVDVVLERNGDILTIRLLNAGATEDGPAHGGPHRP